MFKHLHLISVMCISTNARYLLWKGMTHEE